MPGRAGTEIVFRISARRVVAIGWTPRSTPPAAMLAGALSKSEPHGRCSIEPEHPVRLTFILLAITTTSMVVATRAAPPLSASPALAEPDGLFVQQPPERSLVGTLDQVDPAATEFVVKTTAGKQRFILQSGATIRQGSKTIKASELAAHKGEKVKVRYREASGERRAEWIVLASPPSKAKTGH